MKNLGYYNGVCDELENMSIPMSDRVCFFGGRKHKVIAYWQSWT